MNKPILTAIAAFALVSLSNAAMAAEAPTKAVSLSQVNFRKGADVDRLYVQLKRSAQAVCDSNSANPRITQMDQACAKAALAAAVRKVDQPILTARFDMGEHADKAFASQDY